ncbi:MAG: tetratricopeptide repeat protein [Pyrinomonadaceae bacterium]
MNAEEARQLIDQFASGYEDAYRLAKTVSLAVRIEPELVRALRLALFAGVDAGAEADLWFSPLVSAQTPVALELVPEVVEPLREDLAGDQELLQKAWLLLKDFHAKAPRALQLEEKLTWLALSSERNERAIEELLASVTDSLKRGPRIGLARWACRALPTLPEKARTTEAARELSLAAGVQTGVGPALPVLPRRGVTEQWLHQFTTKNLGRVKVGVRLLKKESAGSRYVAASGSASPPSLLTAPVVPADETPMLVEFSHPPVASAEQIEVPDTYRLLFEVSWGPDDGQHKRQMSLYPQETQYAEVGYGEVRIRTALGDMHTLRPHFEYDFLLLHDRADDEFASRLSGRLAQQTGRGPQLQFSTKVLESVADTPTDFNPLADSFGLNRKIGFIVSPESVLNIEALHALWPVRPEPQHLRDWLVPIKVGGGRAPNFPGSSPVANFGTGVGLPFEEGFRSLWKELTGENLPLPPPPVPVETSTRTRPETDSLSLFYAYSHKDEKLRDQLVRHLAVLRREMIIEGWHDRMIMAGRKWKDEIEEHLNSADLILFLISADFLASDYCYGVEVKRALERHESGEARVIPVILRPCVWQRTPFGKLQALPKDAKPITQWKRRDEAFLNVITGVRQVAEELRAKSQAIPMPARPAGQPRQSPQIPRPPAVGFLSRRDRDGRDLLTLLVAELAPGRNPFLALWGPGGVGKTTLAAEAARALSAQYDDRVVWVSALARPDFSFITFLDEVATQLGRTDLRPLAPEEKEQAVDALVAESPTLVVLDNVEVLSSEAQSRCVSFLARRANCAALVTTRISIQAARNIKVSSMSPDEAQAFLNSLIGLTIEPRIFTSTLRAQIIQVTEASPLLMQWVVAQIDAAQEPGTVLADLAQGRGDATEHVFDRSFNLPQLGDDGRAALLSLSLFTPSATREELAEIAGFGSDVQRLNRAVQSLVGLWLASATDNNRRLVLSGLVRQLAAARLAREARAEEFRQRFIAYFAQLAKAHEEVTPENLDLLEAEKDNLLSAVSMAFELQDWDNVQRIVASIAQPDGLLLVRGYWDEALRCADQALQAAQATHDPSQLATWASHLAAIYRLRGDAGAARRYYDLGFKTARQMGDERTVAYILSELAALAEEQGELDEAHRLNDESLEINKKVGDQSGVATALYQLGSVASLQDNYEEARRLYGESLEIKRKLGDQSGIATILYQLGKLAQNAGALEEARRLYDESLYIQNKLGNQFGIAISLGQLGSLTFAMGDYGEARRLLEESIEIFRRLGSQQGVAADLHQLGRLAEVEGKRADASRLYREALSIFERLHSPQAEAVRRSLAQVEGGLS